MRAVGDGARLIATNADARYPTAVGFLPGAGAIVAALATATGVAPEVIGKPEPGDVPRHPGVAGVPAGEAVVVGDNPDSDVAGAHRAGMCGDPGAHRRRRRERRRGRLDGERRARRDRRGPGRGPRRLLEPLLR